MSTINSLFFTSLHELEEWYNSSERLPLEDKLRIPRESLDKYSRHLPSSGSGGKLSLQLVHDFRNGYQDQNDLNPKGYFPAKNSDYYRLTFPELCDEFIYFSHHRVSIPPISWINQCHKNGIRCLGTIIFEGKSASDYNELDTLLSRDEDKIHFKFVKMLCKLVEHYKFEGFLINVETRFSRSKLGAQLPDFIGSLKSELRLINKESRLVWYDAYLPSLNRVRYGNGITAENYELMKLSDSMLTNYWWTEESLKKNLALAGTEAELFVGVDVWGRGMKFGNGGFETSKLVSKLLEFDQCCGIFAPLWDFEYLSDANFNKNEARFWLQGQAREKSIMELVGKYGSSIYQVDAESFIFYSCFSEGKGSKFFEKGDLLFNDNWINGSLTFQIPKIFYEQQLAAPTLLAVYCNDDDNMKFDLYYKDLYHLGTSLKVEKMIPNEDEMSLSNYLTRRQKNQKFVQNLFYFNHEFHKDLNLKMAYKHLQMNETHFQIIINYYVTRTGKNSIQHKVRENSYKILLYNNGNRWIKMDENLKMPQHSSNEKVWLSSVDLEVLEIPLKFGDSGIFSNMEFDEDWVIVEKNKLKQNSLKKLTLLIGEISIASLDPVTTARVTKVTRHKDKDNRLVMLSWRNDTIIDPLYWNVMVDEKFVGTSVVPYLFIEDKPISKVRVDIVNRDGECIIGDYIPL